MESRDLRWLNDQKLNVSWFITLSVNILQAVSCNYVPAAECFSVNYLKQLGQIITMNQGKQTDFAGCNIVVTFKRLLYLLRIFVGFTLTCFENRNRLKIQRTNRCIVWAFDCGQHLILSVRFWKRYDSKTRGQPCTAVTSLMAHTVRYDPFPNEHICDEQKQHLTFPRWVLISRQIYSVAIIDKSFIAAMFEQFPFSVDT